ALLTMGLVTLASISFGTEQSYFIHQVVFAMISLVAFVGIMRSDYQQLIKLSPIFYAVNCLLLVLVGLVGHVSHGAASWLQLGPLNIQPSEIAKISLLLMLTWFVAYSRQRQWRWPRLLAGMCL